MKRLIFSIFGIILVSFGAFSQNNKVTLDQTSASWLDSEFVGDKYLIQCFIPKNHETPIDSLPVLFILDADMSFGMTYDIVRWLTWRKEIPKVAIIGISYGKTQSDWWKKRSRDYTMSSDKTNLWGKWPLAGGGVNFINFIEKELFPFIESEYKLRSKNKTIVGLSFGGLISTDILFSEPKLFKNFILAGPALQWNDRAVFEKERIYAESSSELDVVLFTSIGSLDNKTIIEPWNDFNKQVQDRNYSRLIFKSVIIEEETHLSMFPSALTKGLKFVLNQ